MPGSRIEPVPVPRTNYIETLNSLECRRQAAALQTNCQHLPKIFSTQTAMNGRLISSVALRPDHDLLQRCNTGRSMSERLVDIIQ